MSFKSNNLDDIKSLYENIHHNVSEESEDLQEIAVPLSGAAAQRARDQNAAAARTIGNIGRSAVNAAQWAVNPVGAAAGAVGSEMQRATRAYQAAGPRSAKGAPLSSTRPAAPATTRPAAPAATRPPAPAPAGGPRPGAPAAAPAATTRPAPAATRPAAPAATPGGPKVAPASAAAPAQAPMSAMDKWRAANPKLAAAADEKARIRGTAQTDNPLMKSFRADQGGRGLPMPPTVQSPAVQSLGKGNQSLTQNPAAGRAPTPSPTAGLGAKAMSAPTPGSSAFKPGTIDVATKPDQGIVAASNRIAAQSSAQQSKAPTFAQAAAMRPLMQSFDYNSAFDLVIEYLIDTGHADSLYEAEYIMTEMEPEVIADIVEAQYGTEAGRKKLAKKVRAGKDVGKKGGGFEKIVKKASKKYGKKRATKIAAAAMWKNLAKEEE